MTSPSDDRMADTFGIFLFLRTEAAAGFAAALAAYGMAGGNWLFFAAMFLVPDLSFAAYLAGTRMGALAYNLAHWSVPAAGLATLGWVLGSPVLLQLGLIWLAHIGFDRMVGYGLKRPSAFGDTHLGWKGRQRPPALADA